MKKILVLLVLCGLASLASAAVDIYITDAQGQSVISMLPSNSVNLYVWYSGDDIILYDTIVKATGPGTLSATLGYYNDFDPPAANPNITATGRNPEWDGVAYGMTLDDPPVQIPNSYEMTGAADSGRLEPGLANPLCWVTLHCDGLGNVLITLEDLATINTDWDQISPTFHGMTVIQQIPEPATIALLCLGGLFLKRKK